ncbi:MAG: carboxypeptidase regulatory-like domain-containing protein [Bacteroidales bacterium]|nr:carboxypeptidase regulatory-like domain-containing protein [Bacteroidales bacterium]
MKTTCLVKFATLILLSCVLFSCKKDPGSIYGVVTDYATNEPVGGANVQLRPSGSSTLTGSDGHYEFLDVPVGEYSITVSKAEYTDLVDDFVIEVKSGIQTNRDVQIKKRPVSLHIYDNDDQEISELDFGADEGVTMKTFNIFNEGTRKIEYSVEKTVDWITNIDHPEGTINVGDNKPIKVTINRRLLSIGDNTTTLLITSSVDGGKELTIKAKKIGKAPTVSIEEPISIDSITYRIKCEVISDGGLEVTERGICYNTYGNPTMDDKTIPHSTGGTGQYTIPMDSLSMATHYYVRAYAKNDIGLGFSEIVEFVTDAIISPPSVTTKEVKDVTSTSALCKGIVTDDGGADILECGVCWGSTANPTVNGQHHAASSASIGEFSVSITGLTANTTYHVRAYAKNSKGTAYGKDLTFKTLAPNSYTISVSANPSDGGTVTGGGSYQEGQSCTITATPAAGYIFLRWTENGNLVSTDANYTFPVTDNRTFIAQFQQGSYVVSTSSNPSNGGVTSGGGSYQYGQQCTVTAVANTGFTFTEWMENSNAVSTNPNYTFTITGDRSLVAKFTPETYVISISADPTNSGGVSGGGNYAFGQSCTVTATPISGYRFLEWTENGTRVSSNESYTFQVTGNRNLVAHFVQIPDGAICGLFTVNANGDQVFFSQGNLQYRASTNTLRFAEEQYSCTGYSNSNLSSTYDGWIDIYGWATSGYNDKYPYMTSTSVYDYGDGETDITGTNYDWGVYNNISNGGDTPNFWRTPTGDDFSYVFYTRSTASGIRYAKACVNGVNGILLLPDDWNTSYYTLSNTNDEYAGFSSNVITTGQWSALEQYGVVFLPAAGTRFGTSYGELNQVGGYWSSTHHSYDNAYSIGFNDEGLSFFPCSRDRARSVRLIRNAQ